MHQRFLFNINLMSEPSEVSSKKQFQPLLPGHSVGRITTAVQSYTPSSEGIVAQLLGKQLSSVSELGDQPIAVTIPITFPAVLPAVSAERL